MGQGKEFSQEEHIMKTKTSFVAVLCILAALSFAPLAQAQCPAGLVNPLALIDGTVWAFHLESPAFASSSAAVGIFKPHFVPTNPFASQGVLTVTETVNQAQFGLGTVITRLANVSGRYIIYPDCSGGELFINLSNMPVQLEFVFGQGFSLMRLLTDGDGSTQFSNNNGAQVLNGAARRFF
jgi:hypothetical protein